MSYTPQPTVEPSHDQYHTQTHHDQYPSQTSNPESTQPPTHYPNPESKQYPQPTYPPQSPFPHASSPQYPAQSEQPLPHLPMTVKPGGNKNARNIPYGPDNLRDWSTGMFDCFDDPDKCVLACCCPCISYSHNKQRYAHLVEYGSPDPSRGGSAVNTNCVLYGVMQLFLCGWLLQINMTSLVRQRYSIRGSPMKDVLSATYCIPCDLVRQSREIEFEEQSLGQARI